MTNDTKTECQFCGQSDKPICSLSAEDLETLRRAIEAITPEEFSKLLLGLTKLDDLPAPEATLYGIVGSLLRDVILPWLYGGTALEPHTTAVINNGHMLAGALGDLAYRLVSEYGMTGKTVRLLVLRAVTDAREDMAKNGTTPEGVAQAWSRAAKQGHTPGSA